MQPPLLPPQPPPVPGQAASRVLLVILCALLLLVAGAVGMFWWNESRLAEQAPKLEPKDRVAAISLPQAALTNDAVRSMLEPWLKEAWQAGGLKGSSLELIPAAAWQTFVLAAIAEELNGPTALAPQELESLAEALVPVASSHPVAAAVVGHVLPGHKSRHELLSVAWQALSKQPDATHLTWMVAADLAMTEPPDDVEEETLVKRALDSLRKMLDADAGLSKHHDQLAAWLLFGSEREDFYSQAHDVIWPVLEGAKDLKPWLKLWAEGQHHILIAWEARGGGYSSSVTNRGWRTFEAELQRAQTSLEESWNLKRQHAGPATSLCYAALGAGKSKAPKLMRKWFDEAVRVHTDYPEAYRQVLWGMRPRWYGSHDKMAAFGTACLETERFDTDAPLQYLTAHADVTTEWDLPDFYYLDFHQFQEMRKLFNGYEGSPARKDWREHDRTLAAVMSYKCAKYDEAQKWLEKLNFKPSNRVLAQLEVDKELFLGKVAAYASSKGAKLREAEQAEKDFDSAKASTLYREAVKDGPELSPASQQYLQTRIAATDMEALLKKKEPVPLIPEQEMKGWAKTGKDGWRVSEDGKSLEFGGVSGLSMITHLARVGANLELSGEFEVENAGEVTEVALTFGYPPQGRWAAARFVLLDEDTQVALSSKLEQPDHTTELENATRYRFVLRMKPGHVTLTVADKVVWDKVTMPRDAVKERFAQIGLLAASDSTDTKVRFTKLELRKL
ncbi:MAG: hypothetical protein ACAH88_03420 [Roseimicrobium sp.]